MGLTMSECLIALGSNLGDRLQQLHSAVAVLKGSQYLVVKSISAVYETAPVGGPDDQGPYLNAAALIETDCTAAALLEHLHKCEADHERERVVRWGARTLDLDLLTYDDLVSDEAQLELPHPRMHVRPFVMMPVCDIAADLIHPRLGLTMRDILNALEFEPGDLSVFDTDWVQVN